MVAVRRRDGWIGDAGRHVEREPRAGAREEFIRRHRLRRSRAVHQANSRNGAGFRHREKFAARDDAEHRLAVDHALLAEFDQIVEQRARHLGPQLAADMQIGFQAAVFGLRLEAQRMTRTGRRPSRRHWSRKLRTCRPSILLDCHSSTARKGTSSTIKPTFSTGVTRKYLSPSRFKTEAKSLTKAGLPIGVFW